MKLVTIENDYINYLRQFEKLVQFNKDESRPYVGVVFKIGEHAYFAPLSSPKPKHLKMKEKQDFIKIKEGNLGIININNMIPVLEKYTSEIIRKNLKDESYAFLIKEQITWIKANHEKIMNKSINFYRIITEKDKTIFHERSNNFKLLEEKALEYSKEKKKDPWEIKIELSKAKEKGLER